MKCWVHLQPEHSYHVICHALPVNSWFSWPRHIFCVRTRPETKSHPIAPKGVSKVVLYADFSRFRAVAEDWVFNFSSKFSEPCYDYEVKVQPVPKVIRNRFPSKKPLDTTNSNKSCDCYWRREAFVYFGRPKVW